MDRSFHGRHVAHGAVVLIMLMGITLPADAMILRGGVSRQVAQAEPQPGIVGINFLIRPSSMPVIMEIYPGTPAASAGLQAGDIVLTVNAQLTQGLSRKDVDQAISDVPGERVLFRIQRHGQVFHVPVTVAGLNTLPSSPIQSLYQQLFGN